MALKDKIRSVRDFPKPGIVFRDITTLLSDGPSLREAVQELVKLCRDKRIDIVIGIESRGFIFASLLAYELDVGVALVRKPGNLPYHTISEIYELEYGSDALEIHQDAISKGQRVLIVDDLLATGGTVQATAKLVERLGGHVAGCCFLIELDFLNARGLLSNYKIESLIHDNAE